MKNLCEVRISLNIFSWKTIAAEFMITLAYWVWLEFTIDYYNRLFVEVYSTLSAGFVFIAFLKISILLILYGQLINQPFRYL